MANIKHLKSNQSGQVVIILLLTMLVALAISLAVTQRSVTDVSLSTQSEQSSRAFSAAEAGVERAIQTNSTTDQIDLGNQSSAKVTTSDFLPRAHQALEYPPVGKESYAQFWLADPATLKPYYPNNTPIYLYFGNEDLISNLSSPETPAVEINLIATNGSSYNSLRYYFDPVASRRTDNGFSDPGCSSAPLAINTSSSPDASLADRRFRCRVTITIPSGIYPFLMRVRVLYSANSQKIALAPDPTKSIPPQITIVTSTGTSGQSQKTLQVFRQKYYLPPFLDYAIFSAGDLGK